eukprot:g3514.t1
MASNGAGDGTPTASLRVDVDGTSPPVIPMSGSPHSNKSSTPGSKKISRTNSIEYQALSPTHAALDRIRQSSQHNNQLESLIRTAQEPDAHEQVCRETYVQHVREHLKGCIFVGHVNTDLDSVAGAIGAAALFDGIPAISERKLNGEIQFALKECGIECPKLFDELPNAGTTARVCLVDHSEEKQMTELLRKDKNRGSRIAGIIDHHALAESFSTSKPLFMDLRPWGSMSTIVTVLFLQYKRFLPPPVAKIMLMAVLSDTLNLHSVTTTEPDRQIVALLSAYGQVPNPDGLARMQFQKKTDYIVNLGAYEMVRGDQKDFKCNDWKVGISVLEVTDVKPVIAVAPEIMLELRILKKEKGEVVVGESGLRVRDHHKELDFAYLFVVDILAETSYLILAGGRELALAKKAFPECTLCAALPGIEAPGKTISMQETMMKMPEGFVSRKAQFAPAFLEALADNFTCHKPPMALMSSQKEDVDEFSEKVYLNSKDDWKHDSVKAGDGGGGGVSALESGNAYAGAQPGGNANADPRL